MLILCQGPSDHGSSVLSSTGMCSVMAKPVTVGMNKDEDDDDFVDSEEEVDPRVKQELEILNQAGAEVNRLEQEYDEARSKYQTTFSECSKTLEALKKKDGASIKKARPYFELKEASRQAQSEAVRSARKFQSANSIYLAAKETISLAELRLLDDKTVSLSKAWQEMLNHAVIRVMEAEAEKSLSEKDHFKKAAIFSDLEQKLNALERKNKRSIGKARAYFDIKKELEVKLQQLKQTVEDLQQAMKSSKQKYAGALKRLEQISDNIHEKRKLKFLLMYPREPGVGAEETVEITEHHLPSLYSSGDADGQEYFYNFDDDVFKNDGTTDDNDDVCDIDNEKMFREMILSISLDEEDTSFIKQTKNGKLLLNRQKSKSLPTFKDDCLRMNDQSFLNRSFNLDIGGTKFDVPSWDRADNSPPDGNSLSSENNAVFSPENCIDEPVFDNCTAHEEGISDMKSNCCSEGTEVSVNNAVPQSMTEDVNVHAPGTSTHKHCLQQPVPTTNLPSKNNDRNSIISKDNSASDQISSKVDIHSKDNQSATLNNVIDYCEDNEQTDSIIYV